jgi:hypothetical protein
MAEADDSTQIAHRLLGRLLEVVQVVGGDAQPIDEDRSLFVSHVIPRSSVACTGFRPR